ncbi:hypothetical protein [Streptomyces sp. NPDC057740]|uniref:hypothetical protein n=1 Tax=Streptomyces sp. NPDC057740 TaxID=3346234 RepID=UPI0036AF0BB4
MRRTPLHRPTAPAHHQYVIWTLATSPAVLRSSVRIMDTHHPPSEQMKAGAPDLSEEAGPAVCVTSPPEHLEDIQEFDETPGPSDHYEPL